MTACICRQISEDAAADQCVQQWANTALRDNQPQLLHLEVHRHKYIASKRAIWHIDTALSKCSHTVHIMCISTVSNLVGSALSGAIRAQLKDIT